VPIWHFGTTVLALWDFTKVSI
jgi:hypothetical protein